MIKIGDERTILIGRCGSKDFKVKAKCIKIYPKGIQNMYLFETKKGIKSCIVE